MISVIVPVYRVEAYLKRCVDSIRAQTLKDLEIILVDDGSPDRSGELCDQYAVLDGRIRVIHQNNGGPSAARNAGIEICRGEYVCFVDGDDEIDPKMYGEMQKAILSGAYDLAICGYRKIADHEMSAEIEADDPACKRLSAEELWQEVFGRLNNASWNKMYRRETIGDLRFPAEMTYGEDMLFNLMYLTRCKAGVLLDAPYYAYRIRRGSITRSGWGEKRLHEVIAKDEALKIVTRYQPGQISNARKYCFRARMNILRALYQSRNESAYPERIKHYKADVCSLYPKVFRGIRLKERAEYHLLRISESAYRLVLRFDAGCRRIRNGW